LAGKRVSAGEGRKKQEREKIILGKTMIRTVTDVQIKEGGKYSRKGKEKKETKAQDIMSGGNGGGGGGRVGPS